MNMVDSVILGLTQGVTEFVPVSSSGHLVLMQQLLSGISSHKFIELVNVGTLLALLIFFRSKIWQIVLKVFVKHDIRLAFNLLLTSIPAGVVGFLLSDFIDNSPFFGSIFTVAAALAVVGLVMIFLDKIPKMPKVADGEKLPARRAFGIGLVQALALIPGVSRSGSTIIAGRVSGMSSKDAAEYSFMASIPIMLGVVAKMLISSSDRAYFAENMSALIVANVVAFVSGMLAIKFLLNYLKRKDSLKIFGIYRIVLAVIVLVVGLVV